MIMIIKSFVAFVGYWANGSNASAYLLDTVSGPHWVKTAANIAAFLQTAIALHIFASSMYEYLDPSKRITVEEALNHPFLSSLHEINEEPTRESPFVFDFEQASLTEEDVNELIWMECENFNPDKMLK